MPEISWFFGIKITMNWNDHVPPHFHAYYGSYEASISIIGCNVIAGALPRKELNLVLAWCFMYQKELLENWELSRNSLPLNKIPPLSK